MIGKKHNAVGVEPLRFQGVDTAQNFVILEVDHRDGPIAHAFQIEQAILDEQIAFIRR